MAGTLQASSAAATHPGTVRRLNEDACLALPDQGLWVVADGMGGHEAGEVASRLVVEALNRVRSCDCLGELVDDLEQRLLVANDRIAALAGGERVIGSTVALLASYHRQGACMWIGDSRVYRLRDRTLKLLTRDHSEVEELIAQGQLLREHAEGHPSASVITRAVGALNEDAPEVRFQQLREGDRFLICSDGLYRAVKEPEIARILGECTVSSAAEALIERAVDHACRDNVTAVVVDFHEAEA